MKFKREKLSCREFEDEMKIISGMGIRDILILTGESEIMSPVSYIEDAVKTAKKYFSSINLEIYPLETDEYIRMYKAGVDGITVYQETYDRKRYDELHISGKKKDYDYRFKTPQRIAESGIRHIGMGVLLGLSDVVEDIYALYSHLKKMEKSYPGVEYSVSFPRIILSQAGKENYIDVSDTVMVRLISLTRILFPRIGINLSTRENAVFRDNAVKFGVTKISAASKTSVGGYGSSIKKEPQFDIRDNRSFDEIVEMLRRQDLDPVFTDWRRIENRPL